MDSMDMNAVFNKDWMDDELPRSSLQNKNVLPFSEKPVQV